MKVSIIIPNYNGAQLLKKNFSKVIAATEYYIEKSKDDIEIIIVDDASTDNSVEEIATLTEKVKNKYIDTHVLQSIFNQGFSVTVNNGVRQATGEIVILLNTDVIPEKDFLLPLLTQFDDAKVFAVGCMDKSIEHGKIVLRGRGIGKWQRGFLVHAAGELTKSDTLWVNGGSGAFRKSLWNKLGGFNELYSPFYWEDIDLSYRALKSGYKVLFEPKSIVIHEHEKGSIKENYSSFIVKKIAYRNQIMFSWLNATDLGLQFSHLLWLPYHIVTAIVKNDTAFLFGFFSALIKFPQIIQRSFRAQKMFIRSDKDVTNAILS